MKLPIKLVLAPGCAITYDGQDYLCTGTEPYTNRNAKPTPLAILESQCVECGATFEVRVPTRVGRIGFNRRCAAHKSPLKRVAPTDGVFS